MRHTRVGRMPMLNQLDNWQQLWQQLTLMMPPESLRSLDGVMRVFEIQQMVADCIRARDEFDDDGWRRMLLTGIMPYLPESKQYMISLLLKCIELNEIYRERFNQADIL